MSKPDRILICKCVFMLVCIKSISVVFHYNFSKCIAWPGKVSFIYFVVLAYKVLDFCNPYLKYDGNMTYRGIDLHKDEVP